MIRWIVRSSLRFPYLVIAAGAALVLLGVGQIRDTPVDVFPEFAPPTVEIQTEGLGLTSAEVEQVITTPLEQALTGIDHLEVMRSESVPQLSAIQLLFEQGTDILRARELVQEKLSVFIPTLPGFATPPAIIQPKSATSRVMKIGISSKKMSTIDQSVLAVTKIRPRLLRVPGVANVSIWGERLRMLQIRVDPVRLRAQGVALEQIMEGSSNALDNGVLKFESSFVTGTGGFVDTLNQRLQVEHKIAIVTPEELSATVINLPNGRNLKLGDIADVVVDHQQVIGDAVIDGGPGLMLIVDKFPWGNTIEVTKGVDAALEEMKPGLSDITMDPTIFRPANFIEDAIKNLTSSIVLGSLLVLFVLILFLFEWRSALISIITIPVSLMASMLVLHARHTTINTMILAGLVIALGAIVDDAIVDIENIVRRLRQHREAGTGVSTARIVLEASLEVRSAVVYASFIEIAALLPIFFLKSLTGSLFKPLAFAYALSVLVSLGVALVLTPALALVLLRNAPLERHVSPLALWLQRRYEWVLTRLVTRAVPVGLALWLFLVGGFIIGPRLGESLFPTFKERDFLMHWVTKPATSHPEEVRIVTRASNELRAIPGVRNFGSHIGRAIQGEEIAGVNFGENWISIDRNVDYDKTFARIQEVVDGYPGLFRDVQTYLRERTKEVLTGASDAIVVRIFGPDIGVLRQKGEEVEDLVAAVKGTRDPHLELEEDVPQVEVRVDLEAAQRFGLKPGDVRRAVGILVAGEEVGSVFKNGKTYDVWVWSAPKTRDSPESIKELLLDVPAGGQVRLGDIAEVAIKPTPNHLTHEGGFRRIDVGTNVQGRDLAAVSADIHDALGKVKFDTGYHAEVLGEYAERQTAQNRLVAFSLAAAIAIILLLRLSFRSWRLTLLAVVTLPMALVGGEIAAYYFAGGTISLGSLVGFFTVLGIVARNGIMMISHYEHLEHLEGVPFGVGLVIRGAKERLAPILMTGLATGLALVPLVVKGNVPGQEIEFPLAIVILGGLLASALLNLFVLPVLYLRFGKGRGEPRHQGPLAASDRLLWVADVDADAAGKPTGGLAT